MPLEDRHAESNGNGAAGPRRQLHERTGQVVGENPGFDRGLPFGAERACFPSRSAPNGRGIRICLNAAAARSASIRVLDGKVDTFRRQHGQQKARQKCPERSHLLLIGLFELFQEFGWILFEVLLAGLAAKLDLLPIVREDERITHAAQIFVRDDALLKGVSFYLGILFVRCQRRQRCCQVNSGETRGQNPREFRHGSILYAAPAKNTQFFCRKSRITWSRVGT